MRNSDGGFTLFEVLGAVAILAILYTTLSTVAIRGLRSEGESRRMMEASLLADWELSEFELELQTGAAPEIGITESEELDGEEQDIFTVTWEVKPLEIKIFKTALERELERNAVDPAAQTAPVPAGQTAPILAGQAGVTDAGDPSFLRVELRVSWLEAGNERSVTRTIFAVDEDAAAKFASASVMNQGSVVGEQP
jgi:prepilin-type N-terminal cleavage/methylation domain-containing protein